MTDEEKKEYEELKSLLYTGTISQYGKRKLIEIIEKQSKEIEELKTTKKELTERVLRLESDKFWDNVVSKDKIKAKIEEMDNIISQNEGIIFNGRYEHLHTLTEARIVKGEMQSLLEKE